MFFFSTRLIENIGKIEKKYKTTTHMEYRTIIFHTSTTYILPYTVLP